MRRLLLVAAAISVFSGCGGSGRGIGATASRSLEPTIAQVRTAAEARQPDTVRAKLGELRQQVKALREQGTLDEVEAARLLAAAGDVEDNLTLITTTTAQPRPPTTVPRPATTRRQPKRTKRRSQTTTARRRTRRTKRTRTSGPGRRSGASTRSAITRCESWGAREVDDDSGRRKSADVLPLSPRRAQTPAPVRNGTATIEQAA